MHTYKEYVDAPLPKEKRIITINTHTHTQKMETIEEK